MRLQLRLLLPREARFVPQLRTTAARFLVDLGVPQADIDDVEVILTEACANVVRHAVDTAQYIVDVSVRDAGCTIVVEDEGPGFDPSSVGHSPSGPPSQLTAEEGRGLAILSGLADRVTHSEMDGDHRIRLEKEWGSPLTDTDRGRARSR